MGLQLLLADEQRHAIAGPAHARPQTQIALRRNSRVSLGICAVQRILVGYIVLLMCVVAIVRARGGIVSRPAGLHSRTVRDKPKLSSSIWKRVILSPEIVRTMAN